MSYKGDAKRNFKVVIQGMKSEGMVIDMEEVRLWKVHSGLAMAYPRLRFRGIGVAREEAAMLNLQERIALLLRRRLGVEYGKGSGLQWKDGPLDQYRLTLEFLLANIKPKSKLQKALNGPFLKIHQRQHRQYIGENGTDEDSGSNFS
ncbi:hypothetical protein BJ878DRAFT_257542 [Calycina marina]|uniref:Uncharacterized protein n=1 Tax=Calycina marina TaxID=1763456 RepID=A0A9P7YWC1_9HELO|nr:hypothetical protein BJ878DRAFT_257542 [Calycina marina]